MLQKSRELTQKLEAASDDDESDTEVTMGQTGGDTHYSATPSNNPWMNKPTTKVESSKISRPIAITRKETEDSDDESDDDINEIKLSNTDTEAFGNTVVIDRGHSQNDIDDIDEIFDNKSQVVKGKSSPKGKQMNKKNNIKNKSQQAKKGKTDDEKDIVSNNNEDDDNDEEDMISEGLVRKRTLEEINDVWDNEEQVVASPKKRKIKNKEKKQNTGETKKQVKEAYIDPNKLFTMDTRIKQVGQGPTLVGKESFGGKVF